MPGPAPPPPLHDRPATARGRDSAWALTHAPALWALHFLACYGIAAVWCAKAGRAAALGDARAWVLLVTVLALAALAALAWRALRRRRAAVPGLLRHTSGADADGEAGALQQQRFMGTVTALLCALSAVGVLYAALVVALIGGCA